MILIVHGPRKGTFIDEVPEGLQETTIRHHVTGREMAVAIEPLKFEELTTFESHCRLAEFAEHCYARRAATLDMERRAAEYED